MNYLYCGIDVSKDFLDYAICWEVDKKILFTSKVENSITGIKELIRLLNKEAKGNTLWVCFEHTGNYGLLLAHLLENQNVKFSMVPSLDIIKSSGLTRGKSDPIDAKRIALYLATFAYKLSRTVLPSTEIMAIKNLLTIRNHYVRVRTQFKNALKSLILAAKNCTMKTEIREYKKEIKQFDDLIKKIESRILSIIRCNEMILKNYNKICQVIGVGPLTAASFIVVTNNFTAFDNPRKFSCYSGIAPFEYSSGTSVKGRTKTSHFRNKDMKNMLFHAASSAITNDMQLRTYYKRKLAEGKHKMTVINAVACKIIYRVFAVVNREEPFVKFSV